MKHFLPSSLLALVIHAVHTAGAVDPAVVISSRAEPSGSSDGGPAAVGLRRAVVVPDLLGVTDSGNGNRGDEVAVAIDVGEEVAIATDLDGARPDDCWGGIIFPNGDRYNYYTSDMCRGGALHIFHKPPSYTYRGLPSSGFVWAKATYFHEWNEDRDHIFWYVNWTCGHCGHWCESRTHFYGDKPDQAWMIYHPSGRFCWYK